MFKKKKIWWKKLSFSQITNIKKNYSKTKRSSSLWKTIWLIWVILIILIWFWITKQISAVKFDLNTLMAIAWFWTDFKSVESDSPILRTPDWKTNILIIWRGWDENDAPDLTDSIMLASLNYDKKFISLFSIPRDLYVEYPSGWAWKINETFYRGLRKSWDRYDWIESLKEVIKKMTWEDVHYFVNLDFEWFRQVIDSVWGIEVNVPESLVDTTYPGPNHSYQTFKINAWVQTLDWATALKYARSRHSTSDFDRSLRQQLIIKALKDKVLTLWFLSSPSKIKAMYTTLKQYVETNLNLSQIIALALIVKDLPRENMVSSNLNDTCFYWSWVCGKWWFLYVPNRADFGWASVLLQNWWTKWNPSNYDELVMYTNLVFNFPEIYKENLKINIFNSTKVWWLAYDVADWLKKYWFNVPGKTWLWNTSWEKYEKSVILYTWEKTKTVEALENFILWWSKKVDILPNYSWEVDSQVYVIIWDDYKFLNF